MQCAAEGEEASEGATGAAATQGRGGASKPGGEDGPAVEVTDEVGASKPITAGDVVGRACHGPGRASVPITAGTRRPGRDEVRRAPASPPKNPCLERREREEPHAHCAPG
jgi:hypothetical protein